MATLTFSFLSFIRLDKQLLNLLSKFIELVIISISGKQLAKFTLHANQLYFDSFTDFKN
jgi:hypothetical protein